ncbi:hypothetical protein [Amycolatopsis sp. MtRt-6]|uniref:hypothetical protein n=1 Tax=Amycolatopsis sp. MtRt-6 TaxID=2792782 RepID=UPI001A8C56EA|nr:hypothetical protein [Amycolatopsis sp. MtRt-6]
MAIAEALAAKTVSENFLHKVVSVVAGICSTIWLSFAVIAQIIAPTTIAAHVGDFLGFTQVSEKLMPVVSWADEPRHLPLFLGAAALAGVLFNLNSAPTVPIHAVASEMAWMSFLVAVQGAGFFAAAGICVGVSCAAVGIAWLRDRRDGAAWIGWTLVNINIETNVLQALYPVSLVASWFLASYRGDLPAKRSREDA